jgi:hypothetical protein
LPPRPAVIAVKMITPYDVIDRIGAQGRLLPAAAADDQAGGRSRMMMTLNNDSPPSPPHSPREDSRIEHSYPGGPVPGSNNPALRKKQRPLQAGLAGIFSSSIISAVWSIKCTFGLYEAHLVYKVHFKSIRSCLGP